MTTAIAFPRNETLYEMLARAIFSLATIFETASEEAERHHRRNRTARQLNALSDVQLADIGLERADIPAIVRAI